MIASSTTTCLSCGTTVYTGLPRCPSCGAPQLGLGPALRARAARILGRGPRDPARAEAAGPRPVPSPAAGHRVAGGGGAMRGAEETPGPVDQPLREGGIRLELDALMGVAEMISRLHHSGWSGGEV